MDASSSHDQRVNFTLSLSVQQPQTSGGLLERAKPAFMREKPMVVLTITASTDQGTQSVFETAVKLRQVQQRTLSQANPQSSEKVLKHEYVPLSLKVAFANEVSAQDIVYVKVSELAQKTGLTKDLQRMRDLPQNQDQTLDASRMSTFLEQRLIQQQEMLFRAQSLQSKLNAFISSATTDAALAFLQQCRKLDPESLVSISKNERFIALRTNGSNSISKSQSADKKPLESWIEASHLILDLVLSNKPLSLKILSQLHKILYLPPRNEPDKIPGEFRNTEVSVGSLMGASYLHPKFIEQEMQSLVSWISESVPKCQSGQLNPIIVAAQGYQKMLSIHPFCDGNGRACRLVMDYILQRCGLPPAASGDSMAVAIFGLQEKATSHLNKTPDAAVLCVLEAVKKSYELLAQETSAPKQ